MSIEYFQLKQDIELKLYDGLKTKLDKDTIFHIQDSYVSPLTGEEMVVIAMDKCTPVAVPKSSGTTPA